MSQPTMPRIAGLQSVSTASVVVTAMPTTADANRRGRARMIRHTHGARRVFRLSVDISVSDGSIEWFAHRSNAACDCKGLSPSRSFGLKPPQLRRRARGALATYAASHSLGVLSIICLL